jgi:thymidylate kinase
MHRLPNPHSCRGRRPIPAGKLIRTLLSGAMGDIKSVNPLLFASLYAQNRFDVAPLLRFWIQRGDNVILDRYVEANFGHQVSAARAGSRRSRGAS